MQDVTLAVIMRAVFGMQGEVGSGTPRTNCEPRSGGCWALRRGRCTSGRGAQAGHVEPRRPLRALFGVIDRHMYRVIAARRADPHRGDRSDVLSMLLGGP